MKEPIFRFKGYTGEWEQRKLGYITARVQGNDGRMELPTLTISAANGWMNQLDRFSGNIAGKEQKNYTLLRKGELSYNHGNSKLAKYGTVFLLQSYEEALVPRVYHSFKMIEGNAGFVEYYFATKLPDRELAKLISSGARMDGLLNINYDEFMGIQVRLPSNSEQCKISYYLRKIDNLITLHQRKCDALKTLKKGMLQKMFPKNGAKVPEFRFKGFTGDWEQRKVIDVAPLQRGFDLPTAEMKRGNYPVVMSNGIGGYHSEYKANGPGVITGRSGTIGKLHYIESDYWPHNTSLWVTDFKGNNPKFVYYLYDRLDLSRFSTGSGVPTLNRNDVHDTKVAIPTYEEEKQIADYFSNIDTLITLHQRKADSLKELKKGMLQKMFV